MKNASMALLIGAALVSTGALAQSPDRIVASGTDRTPHATVIVEPNSNPSPAWRPEADMAGPVSPRTTPPGVGVPAARERSHA